MAFVEPGQGWRIARAVQAEQGVHRRRNPWTRRNKRAVELGLTLLALPLVILVLLPVMALVAADGAPPVYRQLRVGRSGRPFWCYKIRTMMPEAEAALAAMMARDKAMAAEWRANQKLTHDPRITAIGHFLRKTSLDELPQLLNVLRGEMSLVGPRPFTPDQRAAYVAAGGMAYFAVRPGLTGPWQVSGRGQTRFADRVAFDDQYVATMGLTTDLALIWKTLGVVLRCTGH